MRRSKWKWSSAMAAGMILLLLGAHGAIFGRYSGPLPGASSAPAGMTQALPIDRRKGFMELAFGLALLGYGWYLRRE